MKRIHSKVMTILANCFFLPSPLASRRNESKEVGRNESKGWKKEAEEREEGMDGEGRRLKGSSLVGLKEVMQRLLNPTAGKISSHFLVPLSSSRIMSNSNPSQPMGILSQILRILGRTQQSYFSY